MELARKKRIRRAPEVTRALILDTAERIMVEEGYAAVSTRRVAQELGINGATVHYHYPTTDDLFLAVHARMIEIQAEGLSAVLSEENPLEALWAFQANWNRSVLGVEFIALSNHRKSLRPILAEVTNAAREAQAHALAPVLAGVDGDLSDLQPAALAMMLMAVARAMSNEERIGITSGHPEIRAFVDGLLRKWGKRVEHAALPVGPGRR